MINALLSAANKFLLHKATYGGKIHENSWLNGGYLARWYHDIQDLSFEDKLFLADDLEALIDSMLAYNRFLFKQTRNKIQARMDAMRARYYGRVEVYNLDFEEVPIPDEDSVIFCDPPYVAQGQRMYKLGFLEADHRRLAKWIAKQKRPWLITYDDHPLVRELYKGWVILEEKGMRYTINIHQRKKMDNTELVIRSH